MGSARLRDDRVLPLTRAVAIAIVPFLVVAFVVLYVWPADTGRLFAWPIRPGLSAMVLGAVYLGGAYFFVVAARASHWHTVKAGFVPVGTFATLMGVATLLHWDKFSHGNVAFWLWAGLYFTTPFLVFAVWLLNRRTEAPPRPDEPTIGAPVAQAIGVVGLLAGATSVVAFVDPARAITLWPWTLTPLTARVMAAILALGIAGVGAFTERRWSSLRVMLQVEATMLLLIAGAVVREWRELHTDRVLTWLFGAGLLLVLAGSGAVAARRARRPRQVTA
jgi:hypothetical protein